MLSRLPLTAAARQQVNLPTSFQEFLMNRAFTAISLQAALATAILTVAPLAGAATAAPVNDEAHAPQLAAFVSQVSREQVRAEAAVAARQVYSHTDQHNEPQAAAAESTLTRAQVRAEAVEANRLGLMFSSEYEIVPGAASKGSRVASATLAAAR
jgi:hypothetical protein